MVIEINLCWILLDRTLLENKKNMFHSFPCGLELPQWYNYFILFYFFYYDVIETESELHKPRQHFLKRKKMPIPRYKLKKSNVKKSLKKKLYGKLSKKKYQLNMVYRYNFIHLCSECHNPYGVHSEN